MRRSIHEIYIQDGPPGTERSNASSSWFLLRMKEDKDMLRVIRVILKSDRKNSFYNLFLQKDSDFGRAHVHTSRFILCIKTSEAPCKRVAICYMYKD